MEPVNKPSAPLALLIVVGLGTLMFGLPLLGMAVALDVVAWTKSKLRSFKAVPMHMPRLRSDP